MLIAPDPRHFLLPPHMGRPVYELATAWLPGDFPELEKRRAAWKRPAPKFTHGWLARYERLVASAARGAVLLTPDV